MSNRIIQIVGPEALQNELLAGFLERESEGQYTCTTDRYWKMVEGGAAAASDLTLLDFQDYEWEGLSHLFNAESGLHCFSPFAVFNATPDYDSTKLTRELLEHGLRGVFEKGESVRLISRGVRAIMNGELWVRRKILGELLIADPQSALLKRRLHSN